MNGDIFFFVLFVIFFPLSTIRLMCDIHNFFLSIDFVVVVVVCHQATNSQKKIDCLIGVCGYIGCLPVCLYVYLCSNHIEPVFLFLNKNFHF